MLDPTTSSTIVSRGHDATVAASSSTQLVVKPFSSILPSGDNHELPVVSSSRSGIPPGTSHTRSVDGSLPTARHESTIRVSGLSSLGNSVQTTGMSTSWVSLSQQTQNLVSFILSGSSVSRLNRSSRSHTVESGSATRRPGLSSLGKSGQATILSTSQASLAKQTQPAASATISGSSTSSPDGGSQISAVTSLTPMTVANDVSSLAVYSSTIVPLQMPKPPVEGDEPRGTQAPDSDQSDSHPPNDDDADGGPPNIGFDIEFPDIGLDTDLPSGGPPHVHNPGGSPPNKSPTHDDPQPTPDPTAPTQGTSNHEASRTDVSTTTRTTSSSVTSSSSASSATPEVYMLYTHPGTSIAEFEMMCDHIDGAKGAKIANARFLDWQAYCTFMTADQARNVSVTYASLLESIGRNFEFENPFTEVLPDLVDLPSPVIEARSPKSQTRLPVSMIEVPLDIPRQPGWIDRYGAFSHQKLMSVDPRQAKGQGLLNEQLPPYRYHESQGHGVYGVRR